MRTTLASPLAALLLSACATAGASKSEAPSGPPVFPQGLEVKATDKPGQAVATRYQRLGARVTAIDAAARSITLETGDGSTETVKVGADVANVGALVIGDVIHVEYDQGLTLEYQPEGSPTVPLGAVAFGSLPAGVASAVVQATVTVTKIDLGKRTVEFKGPRGNLYKVTAGPRLPIERLKVGDRLLATYAEAVAVSLEKAGPTL